VSSSHSRKEGYERVSMTWRPVFAGAYLGEGEPAARLRGKLAQREAVGGHEGEPVLRHRVPPPPFRGLHSSTFRLDESAFCGIGGAIRGCSGGVLEVLGDT